MPSLGTFLSELCLHFPSQIWSTACTQSSPRSPSERHHCIFLSFFFVLKRMLILDVRVSSILSAALHPCLVVQCHGFPTSEFGGLLGKCSQIIANPAFMPCIVHENYVTKCTNHGPTEGWPLDELPAPDSTTNMSCNTRSQTQLSKPTLHI
jgi:hypothetical protein